MSEVPRHPETSERGSIPGDGPARRSGRFLAVGAILVALLILVVVLHLAGVIGPGSHS